MKPITTIISRVSALAMLAVLGNQLWGQSAASQQAGAPPPTGALNLPGQLFSLAEAESPVPPQVQLQPTNLTVIQGNTAVFQAQASGTPPFGYQWYFHGGPLPGATNASLTIGNAQLNHMGNYQVVVTNVAGTATSAVARLTVWIPPQIMLHPQDATNLPGAEVVLYGYAIGIPVPAYQWYFNEKAVNGATAANYSISNIQYANAGSYYFVASNGAGTATSAPATVMVLGPATITQQPVSQTVTQGNSAVFQVAVGGTEPIHYQWFCNGLALADGGRIHGARTNTLVIANAQANDEGPYSVLATNSLASSLSSTARLEVLVPPTILTQPANLGVLPGSTATFCVVAVGKPALTYQWRKDGVNLPNGGRISGATSNCLTMVNAATNDAGNYAVVINNALGSATSSPAQLTVVNRSVRLVSTNATTNGAPVVVPVELIGVGDEQTLKFSLAFDTNALAFVSAALGAGAASASLTKDTTQLAQGQLGFTVAMPAGSNFNAGAQEVLVLQFTAHRLTNSAIARLVFGDQPVPRSLLNAATNGLTTSYVEGTVWVPGTAPDVPATPNLQWGLFGQSVHISNPAGSGTNFPAVRVLVAGLGVDSFGKAIQLRKATGQTADGVPYLQYNWPLRPGESVDLALEYYVPDRFTVPTPSITVQVVAASEPIRLTGDLVTVDPKNIRFTNGVFLVNFLTTAGQTYYVQYNSPPDTNWNTVLPALIGTGGYVQWIDRGPPQTDSQPTATRVRLYRVRKP